MDLTEAFAVSLATAATVEGVKAFLRHTFDKVKGTSFDMCNDQHYGQPIYLGLHNGS
jgi:hypothetical protein